MFRWKEREIMERRSEGRREGRRGRRGVVAFLERAVEAERAERRALPEVVMSEEKSTCTAN